MKALGSIDGFNVWDTISDDAQSPRYEVLHGLDSLKEKKAALRIGDYKMIVHQNRSFYSDWYPRPESLHELDQVPKPSVLQDASVDCTIKHPHPLLYTKAPICNPEKKPCLFNIKWDPCEYHNLADFMPNTLKVMIDRLKFYYRKSVPAAYPQADESANPDQHGGVWSPWRDKPDVDPTMNDYVYPNSYYDSPKAPPSSPTKNQLDQFMRDQGLSTSNNPLGSLSDSSSQVEDIIINFRDPNRGNKEVVPTTATVATTASTATTPTTAPSVVTTATTPSTAAPINTASTPPSIRPAAASMDSPKLDYSAQRPKPFHPTGYLKGFFQHQVVGFPTTQPAAKLVADTVKEVEQVVTKPVKYVNPLNVRPTTEMPAVHAWPTQQSLVPSDVQSVIRQHGFSKHLASSHVEQVSVLPPVKPTAKLAHHPAMFGSHAHKVNTLPEILDIIDESPVPNSYAAGGSGQREIPKIFDIIDEAHNERSKVKDFSSHKQGPIATSKLLTSKDVGSGMGVGLTGLPEGISVFGKLGDQKVLSKSHDTKGKGREHIVAKEKPVKEKKKASVHKFIGNITIDGRRYLVVGTETEESDSISSHMEGNTITLHLPKSKKTNTHSSKDKIKSPQTANSKSEIGAVHAPSEPGIGEITDYIDEDEDDNEKPTNKTLAAHNITAVSTAGNNTKCEKVVQLDTSDNAVVVSSVVIVVIASAMVVGVAVVAMVAVVARHCQNARN